jgi:hypothetical protein
MQTTVVLHVKYSMFVHVRVVCLGARTVHTAAALSEVQTASTPPMNTIVARPSASGPAAGNISIRGSCSLCRIIDAHEPSHQALVLDSTANAPHLHPWR